MKARSKKTPKQRAKDEAALERRREKAIAKRQAWEVDVAEKELEVAASEGEDIGAPDETATGRVRDARQQIARVRHELEVAALRREEEKRIAMEEEADLVIQTADEVKQMEENPAAWVEGRLVRQVLKPHQAPQVRALELLGKAKGVLKDTMTIEINVQFRDSLVSKMGEIIGQNVMEGQFTPHVEGAEHQADMTLLEDKRSAAQT